MLLELRPFHQLLISQTFGWLDAEAVDKKVKQLIQGHKRFESHQEVLDELGI